MTPHTDIDAVTVGNAKGTLGRAHHRTYALLHWVDQMDVRCIGRIRSGYAMDRVGALRLVQSPQEAPITAVSRVRHGGWNVGDEGLLGQTCSTCLSVCVIGLFNGMRFQGSRRLGCVVEHGRCDRMAYRGWRTLGWPMRCRNKAQLECRGRASSERGGVLAGGRRPKQQHPQSKMATDDQGENDDSVTR